MRSLADRLAEVVASSEEAKLQFPKPSKYDRKALRVDTSDLELAKEPPDRNAKYRDFVRGHVCAVVNNECSGKTEHAHIGTGGKGLKASDYYSVPLCTAHHREQHNVGAWTFQQHHRIDLWEVAAKLLAEWVRRIDV
jgi:hypothetical protein